MSHEYSQYGGSPYGSTQQGGYGYGQNAPQPSGGYGSSDPYNQAEMGRSSAGTYGQPAAPQPAYGQQGGAYGRDPYATNMVGTDGTEPISAASPVLSNQNFLGRVDNVKSLIRELGQHVSEIGTLHQRILTNPDNSNSAQLSNLITNTQVLNTRIKDQIKFLEADALKSAQNGRNATKDSQVKTLSQQFKNQLSDYQKEESTYSQRYKESIARQYRIVNPQATDAEVKEATEANWGDEGVFQTALKSNRTGAANSVLGSVRARHNDIQRIEQTLIELAKLFEQLDEQVVLQQEPINRTEMETEAAKDDTVRANKSLKDAVKIATRTRKMKWICFWICVAIVVILGLILGLYFGLTTRATSTNNNGGR